MDRPAFSNLGVQMRTEAVASFIRQSKDCACFDDLSQANENLLQVCIYSLITILMGHTDMNAIIMAGWLVVNTKDFSWRNTEDFAACRRLDIDAIMPRKAKLCVISRIDPEVLGDYPILGRPDLKLKIPHLLIQIRLWHFDGLCHLV